MPGSFFDTNVLIYLASADPAKADRAEQLVGQGGTISIQVLNELANVARRKMGLTWPETHAFLGLMRDLLSVEPLTIGVHETGLALAERYQLSLYDAMIAAAALAADCDTLWLEDMPDGLVIEGRLRVVNPFRASEGDIGSAPSVRERAAAWVDQGEERRLPISDKLWTLPGQLTVLRPDRECVYSGQSFQYFEDWFGAIVALDLTAQVPAAMTHKWTRVQNVLLTAWIESDLLMVGDLIAFTALEYAVLDRYGHLALPRPQYNPKKPNALMRVSFSKALDYMVTGDGLTDAQLPFTQRYGGSVTRRLTIKNSVEPTLPQMRNRLAHGEPIESGPGCGVVELIRDLIDYAYRDWPGL